jgi:hypothetical protein
MPAAGQDAMKLSKEKQNQLILTVVVIVSALSTLYFGVISFQKRSMHLAQDQAATAHEKMAQIDDALKNKDQIAAQLVQTKAKVAQLETGMASGDLYSWFIETIRQFKQHYNVDIPQFSQVDGPKDASLIPSFPYKQATLSVSGTALFFDLGRFIADFENQFPFARIVNLSVEPAPGTASGDAERLSFRMDISVLVKPENT